MNRRQSPLRGVLDRYRRALLASSADDLADLYAPDAVHEVPFPFPGLPERCDGREEVRAAYRAAWGASPARPERVIEVAVYETTDPEVIVVEQIVTGTLATTGDPFRVPGLLVMRVRDGAIVHVRDYMDGLAAVRAAGWNSAL
ncbi:nuclear transport factor 2 family protein [Streptomyces sp. NPDC048751]|uniref:nuclear transport factor 2 family protein n=1 Tax=Streptomyces sp. NPDC048751 TaxID=3365591 RepID=UPI00371F7D83